MTIDRERNKWYIVDFTIPMDHHGSEKECICMNLAAEARKQFRVNTVIVPIALGTLGTFST